MNTPRQNPQTPQAQQQTGRASFLSSSAADSAGQFATSVSEEGSTALSTFLTKLYGWLLGGIGVAGASAAILTATGWAQVIASNFWLYLIGGLGALIGSMYWARSTRHSYPLNLLSYSTLAAALGLVLSPLIYYAYAGGMPEVVTQAFALTVALFGGLSIWGATSDADFSFLRGFAWAGFWVILGAVVLQFFFSFGSTFTMIYSAGGVLVFGAFTLYETQQIIQHYPRDEYVAGAITLLVDFVYMFMFILQFLLAGEQ